MHSSVFSCECVLVGLWGCVSEEESASTRFVVQMRFSPTDFLCNVQRSLKFILETEFSSGFG